MRLIFLFYFILFLSGQDIKDWGLKGGLNYVDQQWKYRGSMTGTDYREMNISVPVLSVFFQFGSGDNSFSFGPELGYSQKGIEFNLYYYDEADKLTNVHRERQVQHYIFTLLNGQYKFQEILSLRPYLNAGLGLSHIFSQDKLSYFRGFNKTQIISSFAAGLQYKRTLFELRYINTTGSDYNSKDLKVETRQIQVLMGLLF